MKKRDRRQAPNSRARRLAMVRGILLIGVVVAATTYLLRSGVTDMETVRRVVGKARALSHEPWFVPVFVLSYAALVTVGLPASPVLIAGGAVFGIFPGALYNWMGSTLGAMGGYATGRLIGGGMVSALFARKLKWIDTLRGENGLMALLRIRLSMLVPYNLLNIACGMIRLPFGRYVVAAAIGVIPSTTLYTAFADRVLTGAEGADRNAFVQAAVIAAIAVGITFVPRIIARRHRPNTAAADED
jgi:uncharacterized membrane protein YdjX (TVP38/TMEM64 family)